MLTDTIYDEEHYVANASMIEFAGKIEFYKDEYKKNVAQND